MLPVRFCLTTKIFKSFIVSVIYSVGRAHYLCVPYGVEMSKRLSGSADFQTLTTFSSQFEGGFTLIELLVVIVIISILGAITLPGFLNQASKARASEGISNLGVLHRGLQAYRLQSPSFPVNMTFLDVKLAGRFYTYNLSLTDANNATTSATINATSTVRELLQFDGSVHQNTATDFFGQAICQSLIFSDNPGGATAPTSMSERGSCNDPTKAKLIE
jgi:prepilin-type N-terminal cleavage/methylation domain-containing protein